MSQGLKDRAWIEIDLNRLCHNAKVLQRFLPEECALMAVVKANAYGHGDVEVSLALNRIGIRAFAVATIDEGIHLRSNGIQGEILILGYTDSRRAAELSRYFLSQAIVDAQYASELNSMGQNIQAHIKVDTGMHRLGESFDHVSEIAQIFDYRYLRITGIFTHLGASDSTQQEDISFTKRQIERFKILLYELRQYSIVAPPAHIQSSYGVVNYPDIKYAYARCGIALYGVLGIADRQPELSPVLSLKAKVILIRQVTAGESVGYGRQYIAQRDMYIAVLSIGYSDGLPRNIGNRRAHVLINGWRAPVIGHVCMDQMIIDVTDVPSAKRGDIVTIIGQDGPNEISAQELAANAETIPNELLSRLSSRLERVFL